MQVTTLHLRRNGKGNQYKGHQSHQGRQGQCIHHVGGFFCAGILHEQRYHKRRRQEYHGHHRRLVNPVQPKQRADHQQAKSHASRYPDQQPVQNGVRREEGFYGLVMDGKRYDIGLPDYYLATLQAYRFEE